MECRHFQELFSAYFEQELDEKSAPLFEAHLHSCDLCAQEWEHYQKTMRWVKTAVYAPLPPDLLAGIYTKLENKNLFQKILSGLRATDLKMSIPAATATVAVAFVIMALAKNILPVKENPPPANIPHEARFAKKNENNFIPGNRAAPLSSFPVTYGEHKQLTGLDSSWFFHSALQENLFGKHSGGESGAAMYTNLTQLNEPALAENHSLADHFFFERTKTFFANGHYFRHPAPIEYTGHKKDITPDIRITVHLSPEDGHGILFQNLLTNKRWHAHLVDSHTILLAIAPLDLPALRQMVTAADTSFFPQKTLAPAFGIPQKTLTVAVRFQP